MKSHISVLIALAVAAACLFGSRESLAQKAYVANSFNNSPSVIDTVTNTVIDPNVGSKA